MAKTKTVVDQQFTEVEDERRIKDVAEARSLYANFVYQNTARSATYTQVRNMMEGGRPFNPQDLIKSGMGWQTNVNFGDAQASRDRTLLPYWRAVNSAPRLISCRIDETSTDVGLWQSIIEEEFGRWISKWDQDYFVQYMRMAKDFVDFGPGMVNWEDENNPRFKAINVQRVYFPRNCKMAQDEWESMAFLKETPLTELYKKVRNKKARKDAEYVGWNTEAIKSAIIYGQNGVMWDGRDFTKYQDMLVNNDIVMTSEGQPLDIVWLYVKQFSGKIGCYAFTTQSTGLNDDFIYRNEEYADDFKSIIGTIWYDTGTSSMVHSIKGFGIKNYYFSLLQNRMKSRVVDGAAIAMSLNLFRTDGGDVDEAPPVENYGAVNVFPAGLQQFTTYPQYSQGLQVIEMLEQNQSSNNSIYRQQQSQVQASDTATQAKILAAQSGEVLEASMAIYLSQVGSGIFAQCLERLRKKGNPHPDAKRFRERCIERGVPKEVLHDSDIQVTTGASAGLANPAMRAMKFQAGLAMSAMPGVNQRWFLENFISNEFGADAARPGNALLPAGENSNPYQRRQALMENSTFGGSFPLPVDPSDAHVEHIEEHMQPINQAMQGFQQSGGNLPQEAIAPLAITIEHTGKHFEYLKSDTTRKDAYRALWPQFSQAQSVVRGILTRLQAQQQQQAQLQQIGQGQAGQPMMQ